MNLAEAFNAAPARPNSCKWSHWWVTLTDKDRADITAAFDNWNIETTHIQWPTHKRKAAEQKRKNNRKGNK